MEKEAMSNPDDVRRLFSKTPGTIQLNFTIYLHAVFGRSLRALVDKVNLHKLIITESICGEL